jgi:hypothetical protein
MYSAVYSDPDTYCRFTFPWNLQIIPKACSALELKDIFALKAVSCPGLNMHGLHYPLKGQLFEIVLNVVKAM